MARKIYTKQFNKSYARYKREYKAKVKLFEKLNKRNERMGKPERFVMRMDRLNKADFYHDYRIMKEHYNEIGRPEADIVKAIVSDEAYSRSHAQFVALKSRKEELQQEIGLDISHFTEAKFRMGHYDETLDKVIRNEYYYMRDELGLDSYGARDQITALFFKSP